MRSTPPHRSFGRRRASAVGLAALIAVTLGAAYPAAGQAAAKHAVMYLPAMPSHPAVPSSRFKILYLAPPYRNAPSRQQLQTASAAGTTVATTTYSVTAGQDSKNYNFTIVGGNVTAGAGTTLFAAQVAPVSVTFTGTGDVYDPTSTNSNCGESVSPLTGVFTGPMLVNRRWYAGSTFIGNGQYVDAALRGSFWGYTHPGGTSPGYHDLLTGSNPIDFSTSVTAPELNPGTCSALGEIDYGSWDSSVRATINAHLNVFNGNTLPIFLVKNVVFTQNNGGTCCILGYHSAFTNSNGDTQTYAVVDYITDGEFGSTTDQAPLSHELTEWANDPFVNNPTPAWGHIGQQPNCQGNLEVGDPLSGTVFAVPPPTVQSSIPTYHLQEVAYWDWFYDFNGGVNGWYSTRGTFTSGATLCS